MPEMYSEGKRISIQEHIKDRKSTLLAESEQTAATARHDLELARNVNIARGQVNEVFDLRGQRRLSDGQARDVLAAKLGEAQLAVDQAERDRTYDRETEHYTEKGFRDQLLKALMLAAQTNQDITVASVELTGLESIVDIIGDEGMAYTTTAAFLNDQTRPLVDFIGRQPDDTLTVEFFGVDKEKKEAELRTARDTSMISSVRSVLDPLQEELGPLDLESINVGMYIGTSSLTELNLKPTTDMDEETLRAIGKELVDAARAKMEEEKIQQQPIEASDEAEE